MPHRHCPANKSNNSVVSSGVRLRVSPLRAQKINWHGSIKWA